MKRRRSGELFCIPRRVDEPLKRLLIEKTPKLHESTSGKQMLALLHVDRIIPFQPAYLENVIQLEKEYRTLPARLHLGEKAEK